MPDAITNPSAIASRFAERWFGTPLTRVINRGNTIGTTASQVLKNNPSRVFWMILNRSPNSMDIDFIAAVVSGAAIPLDPLGGAASMQVDEDGDEVTNEVWGVAGLASSAFYAIELVASGTLQQRQAHPRL